MGNTVSCCWNSRNPEADEKEENKKKPKLKKNNNSEDEDCDESAINENAGIRKSNTKDQYNFTQISNINPNADDTQNELNLEADMSVSELEVSVSADDETKPKKEISAPKLHSSNMGTTNNSINKPLITKSSKLYLKVSISGLDLKCNNLDDYGTTIKPFVELFIENISATQIRVDNNNVHDLSVSLNESVNQSNMSMLKHSVITHLGDIKDFKERNYTYTFSETFKLNESQTFGVMFLSIKNENGNFTSDITPNITIGCALIPLRSLILKYFNSEFNGYVEVYSKEIQLIGLIKVSFKISDKPMDAADDFSKKMSLAKQNNKNIFNDLDLENEDIEKYDISKIYSEHTLIHYEHLEENSIDKYFVTNFSFKETHIKEIKEYNYDFFCSEKINERECFNLNLIKTDDLYNLLLKSFNNKNLFLLHMLVVILNKICVLNETEVGYEYVEKNLFSKIKKGDNQVNNVTNKNEVITFENFFYNIPKHTSFNAYIIKNYFKFVYHYIKFYRNHKSKKVRSLNFFEESLLIVKVAETIKTLNDKVKKEFSTEGYKLECISCIVLGFNILTELSTVNRDVTDYTNKEEQAKTSSEDFTKVYKNCIEILQKRYSFLRPIEVFPNNSQVLSFITRIFRKVLQMIFSPGKEVKKLDTVSKVLGVHPKDLINTIRKIVIEDHDGVFITSLKIILGKFYHFPEIHLNINLIVYSLTNNLKPNQEILLLTAAEKLDFTSLKENFQIFRGKFNGICKLINLSHLNILKNFILFESSSSSMNVEIIGKLVVYCFRSYFKITSRYKTRYIEFQKKKQIEIEIQELITLISFNLTKNKKIVRILMESDFFDDLIEYIIVFATGLHDEEDPETSNLSNGDLIKKVLEKKKRKTVDESIKKMIEKILKQSLGTILNVYKTGDQQLVDIFDKKLSERDISSWIDVFEEIKNVLGTYNITLDQVKGEIDVLSKHEIKVEVSENK